VCAPCFVPECTVDYFLLSRISIHRSLITFAFFIELILTRGKNELFCGFFRFRFSMQKVVLFRGMPGVSLRLSFYRTRDLSHPKRELYHYCVSLDEINHIPEIALIDCFTEKNCQYICKTGEIENKNA